MNPTPADIADREDISQSMAEFYRRVFPTSFLARSSSTSPDLDLAVCLPVMCDFWADGVAACRSVPRNGPHVDLASRIHRTSPHLTPAHSPAGSSLWTVVVDERHTGETAELAKVQAARIAGAISRRRYSQPLGELPTTQIEPPDQRLP